MIGASEQLVWTMDDAQDDGPDSGRSLVVADQCWAT
jgi:hypothetical protein